MDIFKDLNEKQKEAALAVDGAVLVLAGAGSGKTKTLTYRIAYMISELGIKPYNILAVTFTNKAALEMKNRLMTVAGEEGESVHISTFHSFGVRLLRSYVELVGYSPNFNIYDADDQKKLISNILKELNYDIGLPAKVLSKISKLKEEGTTPDIYDNGRLTPFEQKLLEVFKRYQKRLKENNALDFSDILLLTDKLLEDETVLKKVQNQYIYIMIDEYQDTNAIQYNIVKKIAALHKNIFVVGDEDQSIYSFRGADISNILSFEKDYENAKVIKLERNYRSTSNILTVANEVIKNNKSSKGKWLWTENSDGELIKLFNAENSNQETEFVKNTIRELTTVKGYKHRDIVILYRNNAQSRAFEEEFLRSQLPYKIFGGMQFYQRREIKDVLAYLNLVNNPSDNLSFMRVVNTPARGIGEVTLKKIEALATKFGTYSMFEALQYLDDMDASATVKIKLNNFYTNISEFKNEINNIAENEYSLSKLLSNLLNGISYYAYLTDEGEVERIENVRELVSSIYELERATGPINLTEYLEKVTLAETTDTLKEEDDFVKLMTVHSAKGLEFPIVFVVGLEEELFPHARAAFSEFDLEEERRLFYVAVTRAKELLYFTNSEERMIYGATSYMREHSRFLLEVPAKYLDRLKKRNSKFLYDEQEPFKNSFKKEKFKTQLKEPLVSEATEIVAGLKVGDSVIHEVFGPGKVKKIENGKIIVNFYTSGEKKFLDSVVHNFIKKI